MTDLPPVPDGGATAYVEWKAGRGSSSVRRDDQPSRCTLVPRDGGSVLVVDLGDDETAGVTRSSDFLHLEVGSLARIDGAEGDSGYLATVQRLDLVLGGGDPPAGSEATGVIASVAADLGHLRLPFAEGFVEATCGV